VDSYPSRARKEAVLDPSRARKEAVLDPSRARQEAVLDPTRARQEAVLDPSRARKEAVLDPSRARKEAVQSRPHKPLPDGRGSVRRPPSHARFKYRPRIFVEHPGPRVKRAGPIVRSPGDPYTIVAMSLTIDVVSIGTLSRNALWNELAAKRTAHATTTLIRDDGTAILVDPSLPPDVLRYRLDERTGLKPDDIDLVFLTSFLPVHRRGLELFDKATWSIGGVERETIIASLNGVMRGVGVGVEEVSYEEMQAELELLGRLEIAPDRLSPSVDAFPTFGPTPGHTSLLVRAAKTVVVAGDAVVTRDHFAAGRVWERSCDAQQAKASFLELREIADVIVPGHDNIMLIV